MRVVVEKGYIANYMKIVKEANMSIRSSSSKAQRNKYAKVLFGKNISVENKKKRLAKGLHELIVKGLSINVNKINEKKLSEIKENIDLIRAIIHKLKGINNYFEEAFLKELGIIKKSSIIKAIKSKKAEKYLEKEARILTKDYIDKIEYTVYNLIKKIIFFDKKLLKDYGNKKIKIIEKEDLNIRDLEKILRIESELLDALEAKVPPANKIKTKLFKKQTFGKWVAYIFALLSSFETEYEKENLIFLKIKNNDKLRKKIDKKIAYILNEKEKMLKIREKRALSMKTFKISDEHRQVLHEYVSAASL